jgi:hypothetical protein
MTSSERKGLDSPRRRAAPRRNGPGSPQPQPHDPVPGPVPGPEEPNPGTPPEHDPPVYPERDKRKPEDTSSGEIVFDENGTPG